MIERGVCLYHIDDEPVLEREHGGAMTVLRDNQDFTDWGSAWTWYVRYQPGGAWTRLKKPAWAQS